MEIRFDQVTKRFGDTVALDIPALVIPSGELFCVVGAPGAGKSTTLALIAGTDSPSTGAGRLDSLVLSDLGPAERGVGIVAPGAQPGTEAVSLLDEPLQDLPPSERVVARDQLAHRHRALGTTFVYATDDQAEALAVADRIAVLSGGRVQQVGTPSVLVERPANTAVASFFGDPPMNVIPGILEKDGVAVEIGPRTIGLSGMVAETYARDIFVGIRPEHVHLQTASTTGWKARVTRVVPGARHTTFEVEVDMGAFLVTVEGHPECRRGDVVSVSFPSRHLHVFDEHGKRLEIV